MSKKTPSAPSASTVDPCHTIIQIGNWGRPTIWITVGQGPTALAVGAGGGWYGYVYSYLSYFFPLSPSLWETARY